MIQIIPFETLGTANHGWLEAHHHFSFARYYDQTRMGYPPLLVWNDDTIRAGTGFDMHPHDNMEIITYIRKGGITHRDNQGNEGRIVAGEVQVMSAGSGVFHSEHNEELEDTTLFQIWIQTDVRDVKPRWETRSFPKNTDDKLLPFVSGREIHAGQDALKIYQDASIHCGTISAGKSFSHSVGSNRHVYMVAATGAIQINDQVAQARDGIYVRDLDQINITAVKDSEIILADLPFSEQ